MQNFKVICEKCQNEMDILNITKAFADDPLEFVSDNHFFLVCNRCYAKEKVFIAGAESTIIT